MGNDPFVDFPAAYWLLALGIHTTPPMLLFPSGYEQLKELALTSISLSMVQLHE